MDHPLRRPEEILAFRSLRQMLGSKQLALWTITSAQSVQKAIEIMADKDIGCLLVMEEGRMVGILSERDCARRVVLAKRPAEAQTAATRFIKWQSCWSGRPPPPYAQAASDSKADVRFLEDRLRVDRVQRGLSVAIGVVRPHAACGQEGARGRRDRLTDEAIADENPRATASFRAARPIFDVEPTWTMNPEAAIAKAGGRTDCQPFQTRPWTCTACAS